MPVGFFPTGISILFLERLDSNLLKKREITMDQYRKMIESVKAEFAPDPNKDEVLSCDKYWSIVKRINENRSNTGPIKMKKHRSKKWRNGRKK